MGGSPGGGGGGSGGGGVTKKGSPRQHCVAPNRNMVVSKPNNKEESK